jgi:hypothetical protein
MQELLGDPLLRFICRQYYAQMKVCAIAGETGLMCEKLGESTGCDELYFGVPKGSGFGVVGPGDKVLRVHVLA